MLRTDEVFKYRMFGSFAFIWFRHHTPGSHLPVAISEHPK